VNIIKILDSIHLPVFHLRHVVSETGFYLRLEAEPTQLEPMVKMLIVVVGFVVLVS
jgi:hypothetical protein